ncbi:PREDICTED: uncharacterized protein CG4449 [Atta colombica]|uniref:uncharacterized protein CG4449 n=1 Tax=Atta colombica TaxID=520822 RepID=UPI00084C6928|nr:PREDICTED: uncharacterized protein CG4449 [Atta colombica]XP_018055077.1 PREDICTED: uncharacterized protein CG4449 [Atta colombica]XP_018055086.1 PREDICTED: uncharacterized protein CG4449 [Atta colombica]XP_018055094.1 PREDICTED: uncharacterized protein CG4449 [Atta colombica]
MYKITDSSSDEDDPYTNSVARLRALKKQRFERVELSLKESIVPKTNCEDMNSHNKDIKDEINNENVYYDEINNDEIQTRIRTVRGRRIRKSITRAVGRRTRRRLPIDLKYNVEIMEKERQSESCNDVITLSDDVIALSDDDGYIEDDNYEINIKVYWRSNRIDRLSMRRHDNFKGIFEHYANLEGVSVNEILIMKKDKIVHHTDTPASLEISIIDILDGGIVNPGMNTLSKDESNDKDICNIKVQTANKKQSLTIPLKKDEPFKMLFANCAEQFGVKENNLKLYFDGEQINPSDTPESLDLEGEACIDLHISA